MKKHSKRCLLCKIICSNQKELDQHLAKKHLPKVILPRNGLIPKSEPLVALTNQILHSRSQSDEIKTFNCSSENRVQTKTDSKFFCEICLAEYENLDDLEACLRKHLEDLETDSDVESGKPESDDESGEPQTDDEISDLDSGLVMECVKEEEAAVFQSNSVRLVQTKAPQSHSDRQVYVCHFCGKQTHLRYVMTNHLSSHIYGCYRCDHCEFKTEYKHILKVHIKLQHFKSIIQYFNCDHCDKKFIRKASLKLHLLTHTSVNSLTCPVCFKVLSTQNSLTRHMTIHSSNIEYKCKICSKMFSTYYKLIYHRSSVHALKEKKCKFCLKSFATNHTLKLHLSYSHSQNQQRFSCDKCSYTTHAKSNLILHQKNKHSEKKFSCTKCYKQYGLKHRLNAHYKVAHPETSIFETRINVCSNTTFEAKHVYLRDCEKTFYCFKCIETFESRSKLRQHNAAVHWKNCAKCDICQKKFSKRSLMLSHKKIHDPNRSPFICEMCGSKLTKKLSLLRHFQDIDEIKFTQPGKDLIQQSNYECSICHFVTITIQKKHKGAHEQT